MLIMVLPSSAALAQTNETPSVAETLTTSQLFEFADQLRRDGQLENAEAAYRALARNTNAEVRTEARFRLALMLADRLQRYADAAVLFRQILDEKPDAARVRLELARMQLLLGNERLAEREFRAVLAAQLPPEVEQLVRFYSQTLATQRPFGASLQVAIAPDSNINRATTKDTIGTIIGDFNLSDDARSRSGVGVALRGQAFARIGVDSNADLLIRMSAGGQLYRQSAFDDYSFAIDAGPTYTSGTDRIKLNGTFAWRWFGGSLYSTTYGGEAEWSHPIDRRTQLRVDGAITYRDDKLNDLRSTNSYALAVGVDRAISSRLGAGLRIQGQRDVADDPGYSQYIARVDLVAFREIGATTAVLNLGYSRLSADQRLFLFLDRRKDDRYTASLAATFRNLRVGRVAPLVRVSYEDNQSTVSIYDYSRLAAEFGVSAAF